jgi:prevent-host-death family protein
VTSYYTSSTLGPVESIPVRQLNQDTAGVLARVEHGESLEITSRGRPIARLVPATPRGLDELDDLIAAGRVVPATVSTPFVAPEGPVGEGVDAGELLSTLRDEERW